MEYIKEPPLKSKDVSFFVLQLIVAIHPDPQSVLIT